jgi:hypothetical protein
VAPFDEHGWYVGAVPARRPEEAYSILAPDDDSRMLEARWQPPAARFFAAELRLTTPKSYPAGQPRRDLGRIEIGNRGGPRALVEILTVPLDDAPTLRQAAGLASASLGGFDALIARARRLWQIHPIAPEGEPRAALALAAVLAAVLLGPILAPDGAAFGVKGARERLARARWRS